MHSREDFERRVRVERKEEWEKFLNLPQIPLPSGISMQMIPPVNGAAARIILYKDDRRLSIYFDINDTLGFVGQPYYEMYPNLDDDISRYLVGEEAEMAKEIASIFEGPKK